MNQLHLLDFLVSIQLLNALNSSDSIRVTFTFSKKIKQLVIFKV